MTEETMDSPKLRPKEGVLKESMKEEPKSPIVISRKKDLRPLGRETEQERGGKRQKEEEERRNSERKWKSMWLIVKDSR